MNRKEILNYIAKASNINEETVERVINIYFSLISDELKNGNNFNIMGFGTFRIGMRDARIGIKPSTGEQIVVTPRNVITFKASQKLKSYVNK